MSLEAELMLGCCHSASITGPLVWMNIPLLSPPRLMNLMLGEVRTIKEFPIKTCRECRFSHGGHMFAAANGNLIEVYNMYSWKHQITLRGHSARVVSLSWSVDDSSIVSAGMDGAVYEFLLDKVSLFSACDFAAFAPC